MRAPRDQDDLVVRQHVGQSLDTGQKRVGGADDAEHGHVYGAQRCLGHRQSLEGPCDGGHPKPWPKALPSRS